MACLPPPGVSTCNSQLPATLELDCAQDPRCAATVVPIKTIDAQIRIKTLFISVPLLSFVSTSTQLPRTRTSFAIAAGRSLGFDHWRQNQTALYDTVNFLPGKLSSAHAFL